MGSLFRERWAALLAIAAALGLLVLFLIYSREDDAEYRFPAIATPISDAKVGVPRLVEGPVGRARDFAWRQALILVEIEAITPRALGEVVDQFPLPEMLVRAGDTLTVTVSLGPAGERLPTDARVGGRVPLRLTPIGLAIVAARATQAAGRARARAAPAPPGAGRDPDAAGTPPPAVATIIAQRTERSTRRLATTATVTATSTTTATLGLATGAATLAPPPSQTAPSSREPPERPSEPAPTAPPPPPATRPPDPTAIPGPPEPPTPPPPPPGARRSSTGYTRNT